MSFRQIDIKHSYVSYGDENIAKAFLIPMLRKTKLYRRSVGFFSSTVFSTIIDGIVSLSRNDGKIQLIASPNLSAEDIHAINVGYQKREDIIAGAFERDFATAMAELEDAHLQLLAALIANNTLDIKIAVTEGTGIYHDKLGILEDFDGNTVVFYAIVEGSEPYEVEFEYRNGEISQLVCSCFCSYSCKHEFAAMLQLKETLEMIEKHYAAQYDETGYFAAVNKGTLFAFAIDGKEAGSFTI